MPLEFESRLRTFAEIIVRVGLNLQRGQRLLIAEPYELQGVARGAETVVDAVKAAATAAKCAAPGAIEVIWGDEVRLRSFAERAEWRKFARLVAANAGVMERYIRRGDALLFLQGSQPRLMDGIGSEQIIEMRRIGWEYFGPIAQDLAAGATNWTVAPAPSAAWAEAAYSDLPGEERLPALWDDVLGAMRIPNSSMASDLGQGGGQEGQILARPDSLTAWQIHLRSLQERREKLNTRQVRTLRYVGEGTDLAIALPPEHVWCSAQMATRSGLSFVANLPTEEVFTVPHRDSAEGMLRASRPINYGGSIINGIELEFKRGVVVAAKAREGNDVLQQLLGTDEGASRLGEVALVPAGSPLTRSSRLFYHPLLDENASNHIALGEGYAFCLDGPNPAALNRSLLHVDLPFRARAELLP